jgi:hypothetical protein
MKDEENIYRPASGESLHIWDDVCVIEYAGATVKLRYETEPPHGDFLYVAEFRKKDLSREWSGLIFGRNLLFYEQYIVAEGYAERNYRGELRTIIVDLQSLRHAENEYTGKQWDRLPEHSAWTPIGG